MGTSGTALYSDDTACDVRDQFVDLLSAGSSGLAATKALMDAWAGAIEDIDDGPVFWLALAETQWKFGCLTDEAKERALAVIDAGTDLRRWEGPSRVRRQTVLLALKEKLLSPQPAARRPRRRKTIEVPSHRLVSPDGRAEASTHEVAPRHSPHGPMMQVCVTMDSFGQRGGGGVFVARCEFSAVALEWLDTESLQVTYPALAAVQDQKPSAYFFGRTIRITYRPKAV